MPGKQDDATISQAYQEHRPYLVDLAFRMLSDLGAAEDVVQDAFARLLRAANLLRFWGPGSTLISHPVGGQPAFLGFHGRALAALLVLRMRGEQVEAVHVIADPAQIGFLSRQLATAAR